MSLYHWMKMWLPILALSIVGLAGSALAEDQKPPPHPTLLLAEYHGKTYPVISVEKDDPIILVDGKKLRLRTNVPLSTERVSRYVGTKAEMDNVKAYVLQLVTVTSELDVEKVKDTKGATIAGFVEFSAEISPAEKLTDCYIALFAVDDSFLRGESERPNAQLRVHHIDDLPGGVRTKVKFSSSPFFSGKKMDVFALLYSEGNEVATNASPNAWSYFRLRERIVHRSAVRQWLEENKGRTKPVTPMLQIPPLFHSTEGFPTNTSATLIVATDGTVTHVGLTGFDRTAEDVLRATLGAWLFLPALTNGVPTEARVTVPLRF